jgi:hypothetical protein
VTVSPAAVLAAPMVLTMTSWLVSGLPRQFIEMELNSLCSIWGEMRPGPGPEERFVLTVRSGHRPDADLRPAAPAQRPGPVHPPRPDHSVADLTNERIKRRAVLGGLLNEYERAS